MYLKKHTLNYQKENIEIYNKYYPLIFNDQFYIEEKGKDIIYPGLGPIKINEGMYYNYKVKPEFEYLQSLVPDIFSLIKNVDLNKDIAFHWCSLIGYKDPSNYVGWHHHCYTTHAIQPDYFACYYISDCQGTEVWDGEKIVELEGKSGNLYIINADAIHCFYPKDKFSNRIVLTLNFYLLDKN